MATEELEIIERVSDFIDRPKERLIERLQKMAHSRGYEFIPGGLIEIEHDDYRGEFVGKAMVRIPSPVPWNETARRWRKEA